MCRFSPTSAAFCATIAWRLLLSPLAGGQTAAPIIPSQTAPASAAQAQPTKKVWTNDDVSGLRTESTVSTVGQTASSKRSAKTPSNAKDNRTSSYQSQIAKLRAQLPPIDSQIAELQSALSGNLVNEQRRYGGIRPDDWQVQLAQLEKRRDDIQNRIMTLEDEARHNGVPNNALP